MTPHNAPVVGWGPQGRKASAVRGLFLIAVFGLAGCGGGTGGSAPSSPSATTSGSAVSPTATQTAAAAGYAANLTFTGGLTGSATQAKAPKSSHPSCTGTVIQIGITLNGHDYDFQVINVGYKGPGTYQLGSAATAINASVSDAQYGGSSAYTTTTGTVVYQSDKSVKVDADLSGTGAAHVMGSASCG